MDINIEQLYQILSSLSNDKEYKSNLDSIYMVATKLMDIHQSFHDDNNRFEEFDDNKLEKYKNKIHSQTGTLQNSIQDLLGMLPEDIRDSASEHLQNLHEHTTQKSNNLIENINQLSLSNVFSNLKSLSDDQNIQGHIQSIFAIFEGLNDSHKQLKENIAQNPESEEHEQWFKSNVQSKQQNLFETLEQLMQSLPDDLKEQAKPHVEKVREKTDIQLSDLLKLLGR
jgi:uncharacterized protein (UPF0147 family)